MEKYAEPKDLAINAQRVGPRMWFSYILIGLIGQMAWVIENMYLNTFLFYLDSSNYTQYITITTAASAIVAVITTILIGSFSDKIGKKKVFITVGYILWGLSTIAFGFLDLKSDVGAAIISAQLSCSLVIVLDCIMTFFGSSANDACFNAYVTKTTNKGNRGKVEGVLAVLPLLSMLIVFGGLNFLTEGTSPHWDIFFYIIGGCVVLVGIGSIFLLPKEKKEVVNNSFTHNITYGFRLKNIKNNKTLYTLLLAFLFYNISTNVFMPYLMIYVQKTLGLNGLTFSLVLGGVMLLGALFSILFGLLMDKVGKIKLLIPSCLIYSFGLILVFLAGKDNLTFFIIAATIMMAGYMSESACFGANMRDYTPKGEEGGFQGIRMIFQVAIPMCTGPYIGKAIIDGLSNENYKDDVTGAVGKLPVGYLFLVACGIALISIIFMVIIIFQFKKELHENHALIKPLDINQINLADVALKENPCPSFERESYVSLNGIWLYEISNKPTIPLNFTGKIRVPYAIESPLSLVNKVLKKDEFIYYKRNVQLEPNFSKGTTLLHFDGIDQVAQVYINGTLKTVHSSGYSSFFVNISNDIIGNAFEIIVRVKDISNESYFSIGKQQLNRGGIWYSTTSGIYKPVWIESMPKTHIIDYKLLPNLDDNSIKITVFSSDNSKIEFISEGIHKLCDSGVTTSISIPAPKYWSPDSPYLYDVILKCGDDVVKTYFGFRGVKREFDKNGIPRVFLNNKPIFINGVLYQGYFDIGGLTPIDNSSYEKDILKIKSLGFNAIRLHIKIENDLFYYYCDKYGILVIQDFVNGGSKYNKAIISIPAVLPLKLNDKHYGLFGRKSQDGRLMFIQDMKDCVKYVYNHPCVIIYTIFNEGWGQFDTKVIYQNLCELDSSRLIDANSGWYDQKTGDFLSKHIYFKKIKKYKDKLKRIYFVSECGGYGMFYEKNFYGKKPFCYKTFKTKYEISLAYKNLYESQIIPLIPYGLSGCIYTQFNDVEDEINGLVTSDRAVSKLDEEIIININREISCKKLD